MNKFKLIKLAFLPVVLFALQSCFTAEQYVRPDVLDERFYRTDQLPQDSLTVAEISWQELFEDPYLAGYIERGLANNIDIRIALEQIEAARAYYRQGKAGYYPSLNAGAQAAAQQSSENGAQGGVNATQYDLSATLSWEADIWGKIGSQKRAFEASYLQTAAAHKAVKTELIANIATIYYQLLALDEQLRVTEESIENRENSLRTTRALKEAGHGFVTEVAVRQTEAQVYSARALRVDLLTNIKLLENTLSLLLGETPHEIERSRLDQQEIAAELKTGYPVQLLRNRPDVIAAEYNLIRAFELTNVARSQLYPSLVISGSAGFQSLELDNLFSVNSLFSNVIGSLTQPIFNGRQLRTQHEVAQSQQEQAFLNFRRAILIAGKEVSDALYSHQAAEEKIDIQLKQYEAYQAATELSEELMANGLINYLELLTARENALSAQLGLINAEFEKLSTTVELYRALGGGWE
ncbi:MAG TPA: efflux transporter outer membrane subunit [Balneolaceae bacterium]|nr:efflux transporter outer membrane subunit [Balneolaceae bacterium]